MKTLNPAALVPLYEAAKLCDKLMACMVRGGVLEADASGIVATRDALTLAETPGEAKETCPECGSDYLVWDVCTHAATSAGDGRLRLNEIGIRFFLGCQSCSHTLRTIEAGSDAAHKMLNPPSDYATLSAQLATAQDLHRRANERVNVLSDAERDLSAQLAAMREVLGEVDAWLVCYTITTPQDLFQNAPEMQAKVSAALARAAAKGATAS